MQPRQLGNWRLGSVQRIDSAGTVYTGMHLSTGNQFIIRHLPEAWSHDPGFRHRFDEARQLWPKIHHPHLLSVVALREEADGYWVIQEDIESLPLTTIQTPEEILRLLKQFITVLKFLDTTPLKGHGFLNPECIRITSEKMLKLGDWGLALLAGPLASLLPNLPPEISAKDSLEVQDRYCLGTVGHILAGERTVLPAAVKSFLGSLMDFSTGEKLPSWDDIDEHLDRMLEPYQSEVIQPVPVQLTSLDPHGYSHPGIKKLWEPFFSRKTLLALGIIFLMVAGLITYVFWPANYPAFQKKSTAGRTPVRVTGEIPEESLELNYNPRSGDKEHSSETASSDPWEQWGNPNHIKKAPTVQSISLPSAKPEGPQAAPATDGKKKDETPTTASEPQKVTQAKDTTPPDNEYADNGADSPISIPPGMILVQGRSFIMGRDGGPAEESPSHTVVVDTFFIDQYEVTNKAYSIYLIATDGTPPPYWSSRYPPAEMELFPVTQITWQEAQNYATWTGKRLPTEAEWERAARDNPSNPYPWGTEFRISSANTLESGVGHAVVVGQYVQGYSPLGISDLCGNVAEWTSSAFGPYAGNLVPDPEYLLGHKTTRGGSWNIKAVDCRVTSRDGRDPNQRYSDVGFRCVKDIPNPE